MQSEPQLSAELEKRFREEFHIQSVKHNEYGITHIFPLDDEGRMLVPDVSDLELFLATALEEQTIEYVRRVEEYFGYIENDGVTGKPMNVSIEEIKTDVLELLKKDL